MISYLSRLRALTFLGAALLAAAVAQPLRAADWPNWRGPNYDGSSDAKNLPEELSKDKNLLWSTPLPGGGHGTPILSGDHVYTTAVDPNRNLVALCLDRKEGKVLWQKQVGQGLIRPKGENDVATPSPVTDGKIVVFLFGTGDIAAYEPDGKELWRRNLQKETGEWNINWIYGSSPTLYKGKLYVQVLHTDKPYGDTQYPGADKSSDATQSYLLALEPATGKEIWRQVRPSDAVQETRESYATPIPHTTADGKDEILLVGGDAVTAHDPETGKEIWRYHGWTQPRAPFMRLIPSVVTGDGFVFACGPKGGPVMAIKDGGKGDVTDTNKVWWSEGRKMSSDVAVPLFYKGRLYVLGTDSKKLYNVDPATGEAKWTAELGGRDPFRGSPTGADGKIYCLNRAGDLWVVSADDGKVLSKTSLDDKGTYGSPAVGDGIVLIRSADKMYAFGAK